jgi:hypothetical protein
MPMEEREQQKMFKSCIYKLRCRLFCGQDRKWVKPFSRTEGGSFKCFNKKKFIKVSFDLSARCHNTQHDDT